MAVFVMVIDDSLVMRKIVETCLHRAGYEVVCAEDGESALQRAQECKPDLILLDMILPKMSGPDVLKHLKSEPATVEIPVVVVSSLSEKNREKLIAEGAEDYIAKGEIMAGRGINLLPKMLENIICRINRKRGVAFSSVPLHD